jgi:histidinol-phosphate aminotransferase
MIEDLVRNNIRQLKPYSSARDEFKGEASVFLDANENWISPIDAADGYNRYPDPLQKKVKEKISAIKGLPAQNIFLGNGSDEAIDLIFRIFCEPGKDSVVICPPTYGMYEVSANINDIALISVPLQPDFSLDVQGILESQVQQDSKLLFICSPNNPTGNSFHAEDVELLIQKFNGIVVIDEAYINYSRQPSFIRMLTEYENVVILQTFSKAWGMAGLRLGMAFSNQFIIDLMNKVKPPYNVNSATQTLASEALDKTGIINELIRETVRERNRVLQTLGSIPFITKVFDSDANFLLVKMAQPKAVYDFLVSKGIIVRDRSKITLCEGCLRITIGSKEENDILITAIRSFQ